MSKPTNKLTAKPAKKRLPKAAKGKTAGAQPSLSPKTMSSNDRKEVGGQGTKQARVVEMLHSPTGTTIADVMKATG